MAPSEEAAETAARGADQPGVSNIPIGAIMPGSLMNTPIERAAHQTNLKAAAQAPRQRAADTASRRIRTFLKLRRPVRTSNRAGTQAQYCGGPARRPACLSTSFER